MEDLIPHLLNGAWYTGDIMSRMAVKLTYWSRAITSSSRWVFLSPDILNGITAGYSMAWARNKLTQAISEDTQYICFLCNTRNHWYLVVTDLTPGSINIFNSLAECGNALVNDTIKPLMLYASSFEGSELPMSWDIVQQHTIQQTNTSDCGPSTIANSIHTVYAWDRMLQRDIPPMNEFRIRVITLLATHTEEGFWKGRY